MSAQLREREVYREVQAALLNSSGDPHEEVHAALLAVVEFADNEIDSGAVEQVVEAVMRSRREEGR